MKFALSTNWCNRSIESGEGIADKALELGFSSLELGFHTTLEQVKGFRTRLDAMPVGSVHAFCPVPISAPQGYPELYLLASFDEEGRKMAQLQIKRNIAFAADMGAGALVLHAGRVYCDSWFAKWRVNKRRKRGLRMVDILKRELELLIPELERNRIVLGLENLPYFEGFPDETEMRDLAGEWVRPWFDTGHDHVRRVNGWVQQPGDKQAADPASGTLDPVGFHLNDSNGGDDHLAPGEGKVDFAALLPAMRKAKYLVLEPNPSVTDDRLRAGLRHLEALSASGEI